MRIYDMENKKSLEEVGLFLTVDEAKELRDSLDGLIDDGGMTRHEHINDIEYKREITIAIYDVNNIEQFDENSKKIILEK